MILQRLLLDIVQIEQCFIFFILNQFGCLNARTREKSPIKHNSHDLNWSLLGGVTKFLSSKTKTTLPQVKLGSWIIVPIIFYRDVGYFSHPLRLGSLGYIQNFTLNFRLVTYVLGHYHVFEFAFSP